MIRFRAVCSLVSIFVLASCNSASQNEKEDAGYASGAQAFDLTDAELKNLVAKAKSGDAKAAFRLGQHYSIARNDRVSAIRWYEISAKAGDVSSMQSLYLHYVNMNDAVSCQKATHWLSKAIQSAPSEKFIAENYLREELSSIGWDGKSCRIQKNS